MKEMPGTTYHFLLLWDILHKMMSDSSTPREKHHILLGFAQRLYITWDTFIANDLFTYAAAGAYSFLLSAFPVVLMVLVVLLRFLNASPEMVDDLALSLNVLVSSINLTQILESVMEVKRIGFLEILLGFSIFWMARRFFASIQQSMRVIYRKRGKGKPIKENLLVLAGEIVLVVLIVAGVVAVAAARALIGTALSENLLSPLALDIARNILQFAPIGIIFAFLFLVYYFTPRVRPPALHCALAAAACTAAIILVLILFGSLVNMTRYNIVYGILANVIVLLVEVYLFFVLFLFFAQFQFVLQFYESFLLARLYLLPPYHAADLGAQFERVLFINPSLFYRRYGLARKEGEVIFAQGEDSSELYYVWSGTVDLVRENRVSEVSRGGMFGEFSILLGVGRTATAVAATDCVVLRIPSELFRETIEVDGKVSHRTLLAVSDYVRKNHLEVLLDETDL